MSTANLPRPFGPYTLLRRLAAGGMAEVYLGRASGAEGFEKLVAIKRIHRRCATDDDSMLLDEAKLSVSLSHRNIVQTLDLRRVDGSYVLVMEHVDGYDAHRLLESLRNEGRLLPIELAAHIMVEVCRGLDYAHRHRDDDGELTGIVHRDVSPQNVLLSLAGEVKVADFGIAKAKSRQSNPESGVIKGKYFYMSPEQARAEPLDHRSDIFSAGVVLWELLVGERLHREARVPTLLDAVRRAEVAPPSSRRANVPLQLDLIVARATAIDPSERYQDAETMAGALVSYLAGRGPVHASRRLGEMLARVPASSPLELPHTRDDVVTKSIEEIRTPNDPPLRFDMDDGRPTVAGWRSPAVREAGPAWLWALGVGAWVVAWAAWLFHGG